MDLTDLYKTFEEVTNNNLKTISDYTKQTRLLLREQEKKVDTLSKQLLQRDQELQQLQQQISVLQSKLYVNS